MSIVRFCGHVSNICSGFNKDRYPVEMPLKLGQELELLENQTGPMFKVKDKEGNVLYLYGNEFREASDNLAEELEYWISRCRHAEESLTDIVDLVRDHERKYSHE